ncbi:E3 ubiquitin-protein ligase FANCL [Hondaea fermentalgiana]|uniref:E3 ubiquitin-protein ligase FANCL n=1 Tax=Hondaea fermentalgiana TaxID=2315210 RepID=A0A2R5G617_9STRA|nr:E3 ubiquitin-protein ligase FANCL [Hondaea fermentalgiana]|eukprot:GBG25975.1 E3 ubiquitin-protein ligase FANCL [Hondaea fermentalgiana]
MVLVAGAADGSLRGTLRARDGREFLVCVTAANRQRESYGTGNGDRNESKDDAAKRQHKRMRAARPRQLLGDAELTKLLRPHRDLVDLRLQQHDEMIADPNDLEKDLLEVLEHALRDQTLESQGQTQAAAHNIAAPLRFCSRVVKEIEALGWRHIAKVSSDMRALDVLVHDAAGREHTLHVQLPATYPQTAASLKAAVPEALNVDDLAGPVPGTAPLGSVRRVSGLRGLVLQFQDRLESFQGVWAELDDLDAHAWVLDPVDPDYSILYRRIALAKHCSVQIRLSIQAPRSVCECQFMGSESALGPFRKRFNRNLRTWDRAKSVRANLLRVLELEAFPQKDAKELGDQQECGVCYCVRLPLDALPTRANGAQAHAVDSVLPDCVCPNPKCSRGFHPVCLRDWFQSLPSTRHTFDTMFGSCPYCAGPMSVLTA